MQLGEFGPDSHWLLDNKDLLASCQTPVISFLIPNSCCLHVFCMSSSPKRNYAASPSLICAFPWKPEILSSSSPRSGNSSNVIFFPGVWTERRPHHLFFCRKELALRKLEDGGMFQALNFPLRLQGKRRCYRLRNVMLSFPWFPSPLFFTLSEV